MKKAPKSAPKNVTWRPTLDDQVLIDRLNGKLGLRTSDILRVALRRLAEQEFTDRSKAAD